MATARLLEREGELAQLGELVAAARAAVGALAVVEGPPGIGKTRLLTALRELAADAGLRVLRARGAEREQGFAFGVARQLFESAVVNAPQQERAKLLSGAAALAAPLVDPAKAACHAVQPTDPFPLVHGLYWLCANLADRGPLALLVDDVHWADRPSLRFLYYLSRRIEGVPALLAVACRSTGPEAPVEAIEAMKAEEGCTLVCPRALGEPATAELLTVLLEAEPAAEFVREAHRATGGNPFLLSELGRALAADGIVPDAAAAAQVRHASPEAIARSALMRLARLPSAARELARAVAVLGENAQPRHAAALVGLGEDESLAVADQLVAAGFLDAEARLGPAHKLQFAHPLIRQVLYTDLPQGERARRHKQAARLIAAEPGSPERAAAHLLESTPAADPWVVEVLSDAAAAAMATGGPEIGASYLRRAFEEPPVPERQTPILLELGLAEALVNAPAAAEHLQSAYEALDDPQKRGEVAHVLERVLLFSGAARQAAEISRRTAAALPPALDDMRLAQEAFELATVFFGAGAPEDLRRLDRYQPPKPTEGAGAKMLAAVAAISWTYAARPSDACARLALAALAGGELIAADNGFLGIVAIMPLIHADRDEALEAFDAALADGHRRGSLFAISSIHLWRGYNLYRRGELLEAEQSLRAAEGEVQLYGYRVTVYCSAALAAAMIERGDVTGARQALERCDWMAGGPDGARWWLQSKLRLLLAEGRAEEALAVASELERLSGWIANPAVAPWRSLKAQALDRLGRREEALALAADELEPAHRFGAPGTVGRTLRVLGTLERQAGLDHLREAVEVLRGSAAQLEHAKALAALGSALRRAGKRCAAREPLQSALELARARGAVPLAERAHTELRATGARPRSLFFRGVESLTARERQVAQLAADGHSNPDIAQQLFITRKTVESHLASAYGKLQIDSREQLAEALAPEGR